MLVGSAKYRRRKAMGSATYRWNKVSEPADAMGQPRANPSARPCGQQGAIPLPQSRAFLAELPVAGKGEVVTGSAISLFRSERLIFGFRFDLRRTRR
jgi:hypothetical protein